MASLRNSERRKRKYGANQQARTERNRVSKKNANERHQVKLIERTQALVGKIVTVRTADGPVTGPVRGIESAPAGSLRTHGQFLRVGDGASSVVISRHRAKINR